MNSGKKLLFWYGIFLLTVLLIQEPVQAQSVYQYANFDVTDFQTSVVAHLTGYSNESHHTARSTPHEREETAKFLEKTFMQLDFISQSHSYKMPNVNGLVDILLSPYKGRNVYAVVEATERNQEYVIVGAHYDSEPGTAGAVDNASGVAVTLALAYLLKQQNHRKYNYLFVLFDQEEDDEVGSKAFVQFLKSKPYKIHSSHVLDVIGWGDSDTLAYEVQTSDRFIEDMYRKTALRLNVKLNVIGGRGHSDNKSFNDAGYQSAGFWDDNLTPHLHKPSDSFETVNFARLKLATHFMFELLTNLDNSHDKR